jgi:hypothetical protein
MTSPHDLLGLSPGATPEEIKAAYHAKLKEFPAHSHPEEFKAIRAAYDTIRTGKTGEDDFFFQPRPLEATVDSAAIARLRQQLIHQLEFSLEDLIRATF